MEETTQKIITKLDELYANPKSKNFVLHLVRAYLPLSKPQKVFTKPADLKKFKCALTGHKMISVDEIFALMNGEEFKAGFIEDLKINVGIQESEAEHVPLLVKLTKGRILGYQGEETSTYMCNDALSGLFQWVTGKLLSGDGKINWTIRQMKTDAFTSKFESFDDEQTKKNVSRIKKISQQPIRAKTKLSDFGVLEQLKAKLEEAEKNESKG